VPSRTDAKEREELVELVDVVLVEGGTGAEGLGGDETEGMSLRDLDAVDAPAEVAACRRACLLGGPWI
jgi:hypothetical protein